MFAHIQVQGAHASEGHASFFRPADLPPPDHALRFCPWPLESADATAQIEQMNEEFSPYNQDVCFLKIDAPLAALHAPLTQLSKDLCALGSELKETENGVLLAVWAAGSQTVVGLFDNGGSDEAKQLGARTPLFDSFGVEKSVVRHFTVDTSQESFGSLRPLFEGLSLDRALVACPHAIAPLSRPRLLR